MDRSTVREQIFKLLFRVEFNTMEEMPEQEELFVQLNEPSLNEKTAAQIREKYEKIAEKLPEIDAQISEKAVGWEISRMGKADLTILRLAVYEILFDDEVPTGVAIDEAVELAKKFGQEESFSFVNGVLAKFV